MSEQLQPQIQPVEWRDGIVRILDQRLLPAEERYIEARDARTVAEAIRTLAVRGAPLIGIAAAYALALAAAAGDDLQGTAHELAATRPTAVNLRWALDRVLAAPRSPGAAATLDAARAIHNEQVDADHRCGELGAALLPEGATVLTHCNTGSLATGGIGSALGVIKTAHWQDKNVRVLADETRPLLQGARLTAWECAREGIPYEIIVDGAAAGLIAGGIVDAVLVGADRIAANGDTANKVGTYGLALAAAAHEVPFYVIAPVTTIDVSTPSGDQIAIEERPSSEVLTFSDAQIAPSGSPAFNPAFDITPAHLITAIITDGGVLRAPYGDTIGTLDPRLAAVR